MNNLLLFMCLMGSIVYLCYLLMCRLLKCRFSPRLRLFLLEAAAFFYLFPLPLFRDTIIKKCNALLHILDFPLIPTRQDSVWYIRSSKVIPTASSGKHYLPYYPKIFRILFCLWLIIAIVKSIHEFYDYRKQRQFWLAHSKPAQFQISLPLFFKLKPLVKRKIQVRLFSGTYSPFTLGIIKPIIFIPESVPHDEQKFILRHETNHILHVDYFIKSAGLLALILHWYCPLVWFFFKSLGNTLELLCDQATLKNTTSIEKDNYVELLLNTATVPKNFLVSPFQSYSFRTTKERIIMIKYINKKKYPFTIFLILFSILSACIPVLAYQVPIEMKTDSPDHALYNDDFLLCIIPEGTNDPFQDPFSVRNKYLANHDSYVLFENGTVIFPSSSDYSVKKSCSHKWTTATLVEHSKQSNGGCWLYSYKVTICSKCNSVSSKELISKNYYAKCPH